MYMHSAMIGCEMRGRVIETVIIENKNGLETLASSLHRLYRRRDLAHMADVPMQPNPGGAQPLLVFVSSFRVDTMVPEQVHVPQRHQRTEPVQTRTRENCWP